MNPLLRATGLLLFFAGSLVAAQDTPVDIVYGEEESGFLGVDSVSEFQFKGSRGDRVSISAIAVSGLADIALELYTPDGDLLFEDDNSNFEGDNNPLIYNIELPDTGTYHIVVRHCRACDTDTTAAFTVILFLENDEHRPESELDSDIFAEGFGTRELTYGTSVAGTVAPNQIVDYRFRGEEGDQVNVEVRLLGGNPIEVAVLLVDAEQIISSDIGAYSHRTLRIEGVALPSYGEYWVMVLNCIDCTTGDQVDFEITLATDGTSQAPAAQATRVPASQPDTGSPTSGIVSAEQAANVRACTSTNCPVLAVLEPGDAVTITDSVNGWYEIQLEGGQLGYIYAPLVTVSD